MKRFFLVFSLFSVILATAYFSRYFLFHKQDSNYLIDRFSHSQWSIPLSTRKISDDQLYYVAAIKLLNGSSPFDINPEVPTTGKYLYAIGIKFFGNPHIISFLLFIGTIALTILLSNKFTRNLNLSILAGLIIGLSPAFSSQIGMTMLELPLTFFLLLHLLCLLNWQQSKNKIKKIFWLLIAGFALGGFASTKFPLFVPILVLADLYFFVKIKRILGFIILNSVAFLFYLASYFQYFLLDHSLIEWMKSIYWTIKFYGSAQSDGFFLQFLPAIFTGHYWNGEIIKVLEWTIVWPILFLVSVASLLKLKNNKLNLQQKYLAIFSGLYLLLLIFVDFRARYFFPLIPILSIIGLTYFSFKTKFIKFLLKLIIAISLLQFVFFWRSNPSDMISQFKKDWENGHYKDMYAFIDSNSVEQSRDEFHNIITKEINQNLMIDKQKIKINLNKNWPWQNKVDAKIEITYETPIGIIKNEYPLVINRVENKWMIVWDWEFLLQNFEPNCKTSFDYSNQKGKLLTKDGFSISEFYPKKYVRLNTSDLENNSDVFSALAELINSIYPVAENMLQNDANGRDWLNLKTETKPAKKKTILDPYLDNWIGYERQINPLLEKFDINEIREIENKYPELFAQVGGTIFVDCQEKQYKIEVEEKRKDVKIDKNLEELFNNN